MLETTGKFRDGAGVQVGRQRWREEKEEVYGRERGKGR